MMSARRIFSGIQPTGIPHIGNYFGAIAQWIRLTNERKVTLANEVLECEQPIFSIVDVHSYTSKANIFGRQLYERILETTAVLLALGLEPKRCILFRQSDLFEHNYLDNVLNSFVTVQRLHHMTQFKEKSAQSKTVSNGLLSYPVLQAADILLYKADLVPVGEDQIQHIELTRDIAKKFNSHLEENLFPLPEALLNGLEHARRVKSLREPAKKMSKSDANQKSFIGVVDEPDVVIEKCKKSLSDFESQVYYDVEKRPSVSNLMRIYHLTTGDSIDQIEYQFRNQTTAEFKLKLAEVLIEKFSKPREEFKRLQGDRIYLEKVLKMGAEKARPIASGTIAQVRYLLGSYRPNE